MGCAVAVTDLWHRRDGQPCPECRLRTAGSPAVRHGRGRRWRVVVPGHPARLFTDRQDAQQWERDLLDRPQIGGAAVGTFVAAYMAGKADLSPGGLGAITAGARHVLSRWEWVDVADVHQHEVQAWIAGLQVRQGPRGAPLVAASAESKIKALQVLRGALAIAIKTGALVEDPTAGVSVRRRTRHDPIYLTVAELGRLATAAGEHEAMVWLLGTTGVRIGECVALDVPDITTGRKPRLRVRQSKSGRGRDVPIPLRVLARLDLDHEGPLFRGARGGRIDPKHWRERVFQPALVASGMRDGMHIHDLRHTAVRLMVQSGATVKDVQAALGHASAKMTLDTYAGLFDHGLDDVGARMDRLLG